MGFFLVFSKVVVIFLLIAVGYITYKKGIVTSKGQQELTNLLLNVFLPCALIRTFQMKFDRNVFGDGLKILLTMTIIYLVATVFTIFISKLISKDTDKQIILMLGMVLPNVGFMGYPIIESVLGSEYIFYAVMGNIAFETFSWSIIVSLIVKSTGVPNDKSILHRLATTPPIIAIVFGILMYISPWHIPQTIFSTINILGDAMTPVAMLIVGMSLAKADLKKVFLQKELYMVSAVRLLVIPLLVGAVLRFLGFEGVLRAIPIIVISMPSAGYTSILAEKFGADSTYGAEIVTICTLLSMITIPLIFSLIL